VDENGRGTSTLWLPAPGQLPLFKTREDAQKILAYIRSSPPSNGERSRIRLHWEIRGISKEYLAFLQGDPNLRLFEIEVAHSGQAYGHPLDHSDHSVTLIGPQDPRGSSGN